MKLWEVAHARSGDKGNISNISVIVYDQSNYPLIKENVTEKSVKQWLGSFVKGKVIRYTLPQLGALNFVLYDALNGGVTSSNSLDRHGKSLSAYLLQMPLKSK